MEELKNKSNFNQLDHSDQFMADYYSRILKLEQEFQTTHKAMKKNHGYSCLSPTVCGVWSHGNDDTPDTNPFYQETFPAQTGTLWR